MSTLNNRYVVCQISLFVTPKQDRKYMITFNGWDDDGSTHRSTKCKRTT